MLTKRKKLKRFY